MITKEVIKTELSQSNYPQNVIDFTINHLKNQIEFDYLNCDFKYLGRQAKKQVITVAKTIAEDYYDDLSD